MLKVPVQFGTKIWLFTFILLFLVFEIRAEITLPAVLGDNMVLQQNKSACLWGKAQPNHWVFIVPSWDKTKHRTRADQSGEWQITIPTGKAGGPYTITVSDGTPKVIRNVMLGEVWICSGQSNMSMPMRGYYGQYINGSDVQIVTAGQNKNLRLFTVDEQIAQTPQADCKGAWMESSPATASEFSATAYYFGLNLAKVMPDVPIGLLCSSVGGSTIEAWIDEGSLKRLEGIDKSITYGYKKAHQQASVLYNGMISPIKKYTARGFIWYQGESNTDNYFDYAKLMKCMVTSWRNDWGDEQMPFYYVQLVQWNYGDRNGEELPLTVEAQYQALDLILNSGIAATTDLAYDLAIHPPQKDVVGYRLSLLASAQTYGIKGIQHQAPRFKSAHRTGEKVVVDFDNLPYGLRLTDEVTGFEVASEDKVFHPVKAYITEDRDKVEILIGTATPCVYVQYAFRNYMKSNLMSTSGLPLVPFRSKVLD